MPNQPKFIVCPCGSEKFSANTMYRTTVNIETDGSWHPIDNSFSLVEGSVQCLQCGSDVAVRKIVDGTE
jgi:hypothetical protein